MSNIKKGDWFSTEGNSQLRQCDYTEKTTCTYYRIHYTSHSGAKTWVWEDKCILYKNGGIPEVGNQVEIINPGNVFLRNTAWASKHKIAFTENKQAIAGTKGTVIKVAPCNYGHSLIVCVGTDEDNFLIKPEGVRFIGEDKDKGADLIGKTIRTSLGLPHKVLEFKEKTGNLKLKPLKCTSSYYPVNHVRKQIKNGNWELFDTEQPLSSYSHLIGKPFTRGGEVQYVITEDTVTNSPSGKQRLVVEPITGKNTHIKSRYDVSIALRKFDEGKWKLVEEDKRSLSEMIGKAIVKQPSGMVYRVLNMTTGESIELKSPSGSEYLNEKYTEKGFFEELERHKDTWKIVTHTEDTFYKEEPVAKTVTETAKDIYDEFKNVGWELEDFEILHWRTVKDYLIQKNVRGFSAEDVRNRVIEIATAATNKTIKEKEMKKINNTIQITVPMAAYAVTETITSYGEEVAVTDEEGLLAIMAKIDEEQEQLKKINKTASSSRIKGQINKLGAARTKIVELLDKLPDE